jgi:hypothetical protein
MYAAWEVKRMMMRIDIWLKSASLSSQTWHNKLSISTLSFNQRIFNLTEIVEIWKEDICDICFEEIAKIFVVWVLKRSSFQISTILTQIYMSNLFK